MPFAPLPRLRSQVVAISRRLHENGWVANHDGNASVRLNGNRFLITCSSISKREVDDASLLVVDTDGEVLEGRGRPFSELELHLAAYRARPEVDAVLHAHPPYATAFGLAALELSPIAIPEIIVSLGDRIPTLPRALPKDAEAIKRLETCSAQHDALLLSGNWVITLGAELHQSLHRMELVDHSAKLLDATRA